MGRDEVLNNFDEYDIEEKVTDTMVQVLGIPAHLKGYAYIREGLIIALKDPSQVTQITKCVYPDIARVFRTTDQKVERAIRNAVEVSWTRRNVDETSKIFGPDREYRPTNSEFIAGMSEYIFRQLKREVVKGKE